MKISSKSWFWAAPAILAGAMGAVDADIVRAQDGDEEERVLEIGKWYPTLEAGLQLSQSSYSDNWSGGDKGTIVWTAIIDGTAERQMNEKFNLNNTLKLAYGQTQSQFVDRWGDRRWEEPEKSTDLIDLESIGRFTLGALVDPFVSVRFESQFQDATDPAGRTLTLNPMKFKESAGIARVFIDEEDRNLTSRLGLSFRQNIRRQFVVQPTDTDPFPTNTDTESEMTNDGGLELVTDYKTKILEDRVTWKSKFSVYQPVFYSAKDDFDLISEADLMAGGLDSDIKDFTTTADLDWENLFTTKLTDIVSVNFYLRWVYDKYDNSVVPVFNDDGDLTNASALRVATRKAGQFKQTMGIGLTYRFL